MPGSLNVTMVNAAVGTRAAWVVDPESDVIVTAASDADAGRMARLLEAVGFRAIARLSSPAASPPGTGSARAIESTPSIDVATLADRLRDGEVELLDVREDDEWQDGHVPGSLHVPYHELSVNERASSTSAARGSRWRSLLGREPQLARGRRCCGAAASRTSCTSAAAASRTCARRASSSSRATEREPCTTR